MRKLYVTLPPYLSGQRVFGRVPAIIFKNFGWILLDPRIMFFIYMYCTNYITLD